MAAPVPFLRLQEHPSRRQGIWDPTHHGGTHLKRQNTKCEPVGPRQDFSQKERQDLVFWPVSPVKGLLENYATIDTLRIWKLDTPSEVTYPPYLRLDIACEPLVQRYQRRRPHSHQGEGRAR